MTSPSPRSSSSVAICIAMALLVGCSSPPTQDAPDPLPQPTQFLGGNTNPVYVRCMQDAGWLSHEMEEGGVIFGAPAEQESAFKESEDACEASAGMDTSLPATPLSEEDFRRGYESMVSLRECLDSAGYEVGEPPTLQSYIDSDAAWTPTVDVPPTDLLGAEEACPQGSF